MAHRKRLFQGRMTLAILGALGFGLLMAGSIFISNKTVRMRTEIAGLASRRDFLEARSGLLLADWNAATAGPVIVRRAQRELGLVIPEDPDLVLVCREAAPIDEDTGLWRKFLSRFGGGATAQAAMDPTGLVAGTMVSLTPRAGAGNGERP